MSRTITIVGTSARAAAQSAASAGFFVHAADLFADSDLCQIAQAVAVSRYPLGLADAVRGAQPGGWMYTGALENCPALVDRTAALRILWGNSGRVLRRIRQPETWTEALLRAGLQCPAVADDPRGLACDGSWLEKPLRSAGGDGIVSWQGRGRRAKTYFQRRVEGLACSAVYIAAAGAATLLGATRQLVGAAWTGADGFRYCGSVGPIVLESSVRAAFVRIGEVLAREFDLVGLFGVDAILNADGVWPVEINPRYPASAEIFDRALGVSVVELHVDACEYGRLPDVNLQSPRGVHGKAIVYALHRTEVQTSWNWGPRYRAGHTCWLADIPHPGTRLEAGWPVVSVLADGASERDVLDHLERGVMEIRRLLDARI